jgi:hypothetical protein
MEGPDDYMPSAARVVQTCTSQWHCSPANSAELQSTDNLPLNPAKASLIIVLLIRLLPVAACFLHCLQLPLHGKIDSSMSAPCVRKPMCKVGRQ